MSVVLKCLVSWGDRGEIKALFAVVYVFRVAADSDARIVEASERACEIFQGPRSLGNWEFCEGRCMACFGGRGDGRPSVLGSEVPH
jgi:hypothetical protein